MRVKFNIKPLTPVMGTPRKTTRPASLVTPGGSTAVKEIPKYTGTAMIGVATMHKSNAVPVFSDEHAVDISSMRR